MVNAHEIRSRIALDMNAFDAGPAFDLGPPATMPDRCVLDEPGWTLFSFDFARSEAVFLDIGADCDLRGAPFSYDQQYASARRMLRLPFVDVIALAKQINSAARLIHLFNIGHCGSTLLHHVFNRAGGVWCISEPLFTFDAAMRRGDCTPGLLRDLLWAGLQFLRLFTGARGADVIVVKHFSQTTRLIADYHAIHPVATCLFLYREGAAWCNSIYHFVQRFGSGLQVPPEDRTFMWWIVSGAKPQSMLDEVVGPAALTIGFDALAAVAWVSHLRDSVLTGAAGVPLLPLRYEELDTHRAAVIGQLFDHCGISKSHLPAALLAFDADSHAGTTTARDIAVLDLGPESLGMVRRTFAHPRLNFPADTILPGTLMP